MCDTKSNGLLIDDKDLQTIQQIASKYNISVSDFARLVARQAENKLSRYVRLSEVEYETLKRRVKEQNTTITGWCYLACKYFIHSNDAQAKFIDKVELKSRTGNLVKRICVSVKNKHEDTELVALANSFGVDVTVLIRYCAMRFDGKGFVDK